MFVGCLCSSLLSKNLLPEKDFKKVYNDVGRWNLFVLFERQSVCSLREVFRSF